jgi:hypothetical protein
MDKVLLSLKTKALGYDADYDFFLGMVLKCLQSPKLFSVNEWLNFEDFIINEYCKHLLDKYCTENSVQGPCSKIKKTKSSILIDFRCKRKKRIEKESYLKTTFAEDVLRSRAELMKLTKIQKNSMD